MGRLLRHWQRILITLVPVVLALLHAVSAPLRPIDDGLDFFIYDLRLRATMPERLDPRIVIVDIDDASLQAVGQWPWGRDKLAHLTDEIMVRQQAAVLGFDVVFAEADQSSGLAQLQKLSRGPLRDNADVAAEVERLKATLDYDGISPSHWPGTGWRSATT
ncbi:CHASE2 domain-containing protein [Variovorax brevis]|uniref:CHASE2 domain-containing protein n=1 Tax=Variovorax brevis TaxID=3053503 RepID=UPI0033653720